MTDKAKKKGPKGKRVQLVLGEKDFENLKALKKGSQASSFSEVIRNTLVLVSWLRKNQKEGAQVVLAKGDTIISIDELVP